MAGPSGTAFRRQVARAAGDIAIDSGGTVGIDIYGGDSRVIAARDELMRISANLELAISRLSQAPIAMPVLFLDFLPNLLPNLQLAVQLPPVLDELRRLANGCQLAAESYFSNEAQITHLIQGIFAPVERTSSLLAQANPVSAAMSDIVGRTGAALAFVGIATAPSLGSTQLIAQGARVFAHSVGHPHPAALLAGFSPPTMSSGSATLLSSATTWQQGSLSSLLDSLHDGYWSPPGSVRILSFDETEGRTLVVLIPGTQNFGLGSNPLNLASNIGVFSGAGAASQSAVEAALSELTAGPSDRVIFVGHSQGGIIGANLASTPQSYSVAGLITAGAPVAHLNLAVPTVSLQHQQDPIPLLSGTTNPMRENWVTVSSNQEYPNLVSAHHISSYAETAALAEADGNQGLQAVLKQMRLPTGKATEYVFRLGG